MKRVRSLLALLTCVCACQSAQPPGAPAPVEPTTPRRVVLLSVDGAGMDELTRFWQEGAFPDGGFSRFFREGLVADRLIPVDPTKTATNHVSLATGYSPSETGIMGNEFHPAGSPFLEEVSGFSAPIRTETLWEAARRQGRRVATSAWPGADGNGERRRADWGLTYVNDPERPAELAVLESRRWEPADEFARVQGIESRSPVRGAQVKVGSGGPGAQTINLLAVDSTDDRTVNYDGLVVLQARGEGLSPKPAAPLPAGGWAEIPCQVFNAASESRNAVCQVKLLELDPGLQRVRIYFSAVFPLQAYPSSFARALADRGLYWPGPPDGARLEATWQGRPGIDLDTWTEQTERFARFFGESLRAAAAQPGWDLILGYTPVVDEARHQLNLVSPRQPGFSPERRDEFARARRRVWQAVDRELANLLAELDLQTTVVAVVSDHGMAPIHTMIDPNVLLKEQGLLAAAKGEILPQGTVAYALGSGGMHHVYVAPGRQDLLPRLRKLFAGWTVEGERPVERIFSRREAREIGLAHPDSGDLILFMREGFGVQDLLGDGRAVVPATEYGKHGYLSSHPSMHGIFLALGAGVGHGSAGTVRNTEVAGRVAAWLGMEKPRKAPLDKM